MSGEKVSEKIAVIAVVLAFIIGLAIGITFTWFFYQPQPTPAGEQVIADCKLVKYEMCGIVKIVEECATYYPPFATRSAACCNKNGCTPETKELLDNYQKIMPNDFKGFESKTIYKGYVEQPPKPQQIEAEESVEIGRDEFRCNRQAGHSYITETFNCNSNLVATDCYADWEAWKEENCPEFKQGFEDMLTIGDGNTNLVFEINTMQPKFTLFPDCTFEIDFTQAFSFWEFKEIGKALEDCKEEPQPQQDFEGALRIDKVQELGYCKIAEDGRFSYKWENEEEVYTNWFCYEKGNQPCAEGR